MGYAMRTGILAISLATVAVILSPYACAFGEPNETNSFLTLRDYLEYAEAHNAGLKSSYQQMKIASEQVPQAKALPDPQVYIRLLDETIGPADEADSRRDADVPVVWQG